jgi:hypothetical protein
MVDKPADHPPFQGNGLGAVRLLTWTQGLVSHVPLFLIANDMVVYAHETPSAPWLQIVRMHIKPYALCLDVSIGKITVQPVKTGWLAIPHFFARARTGYQDTYPPPRLD